MSKPKKIFWSDLERALMVKAAVDLRSQYPGLDGLTLLKASIEVLPRERQRQVIALSQAPWFLPMVAEEASRRGLEARLEEDTVTVLRQYHEHHDVWMVEQLARYDRMLPLLERLAQASAEQTAWALEFRADFDAGQAGSLEAQRRMLELLAKDAAANDAHARLAEKWVQVSRESMVNLAESQAQMVALLAQIARELAALNRHLRVRPGAGAGTPSPAASKRRRGRGTDPDVYSTRRA